MKKVKEHGRFIGFEIDGMYITLNVDYISRVIKVEKPEHYYIVLHDGGSINIDNKVYVEIQAILLGKNKSLME